MENEKCLIKTGEWLLEKKICVNCDRVYEI